MNVILAKYLEIDDLYITNNYTLQLNNLLQSYFETVYNVFGKMVSLIIKYAKLNNVSKQLSVFGKYIINKKNIENDTYKNIFIFLW